MLEKMKRMMKRVGNREANKERDRIAELSGGL
jgi:hypothetical protein